MGPWSELVIWLDNVETRHTSLSEDDNVSTSCSDDEASGSDTVSSAGSASTDSPVFQEAVATHFGHQATLQDMLGEVIEKTTVDHEPLPVVLVDENGSVFVSESMSLREETVCTKFASGQIAALELTTTLACTHSTMDFQHNFGRTVLSVCCVVLSKNARPLEAQHAERLVNRIRKQNVVKATHLMAQLQEHMPVEGPDQLKRGTRSTLCTGVHDVRCIFNLNGTRGPATCYLRNK